MKNKTNIIDTLINVILVFSSIILITLIIIATICGDGDKGLLDLIK
jgi:hypothetical protein